MKTNLRTCGLLVAAAASAASVLTACSGEAASTVAADCKPQHADVKTISDGKLSVGVIDIPPFSSYNSGKPKGIDVDIVKRIAKEECLEPVYQQATYADAIQSIAGGQIDLAIGTIDATAARLKVVDFSASTYLDGMGLASKSGAATIADLEKADSVGTIDGYLWVDDLKKILGSKLKTYPSSVELKADFDAGRLDVAVDAYGAEVPEFAGRSDVTVNLANEHPDPRVQAIVKSPEAAFPLTKGNESLKKATSEDIVAMREDGSISRWLTDAGLKETLGDVGETQYVVS